MKLATDWNETVGSTSAQTDRLQRVGVVLLHLALPGAKVRPAGVLLLDFAADSLYCKINSVVPDEDASEILGHLTEQFTAMSKERGGKFVLDYLQEMLSNSLQAGDLEQLFILNHPAEAAKQIYAERVAPFIGAPLVNHYYSHALVPRVLVVEDNPAEVDLIKMALHEYSPATAITVATDGEEAIQLIESSRNLLEPDLVLLDLNLPKRSGHEVLKSLRANPRLCSTPVAIFSSSNRRIDEKRAYAEGANCYVQKASDLVGFCASVSELCSRFLGAAAA